MAKSKTAKATAVKSEDLTIVNPPVASSAQVAEPQTDTHIGQAQVFCLMVLTGEVRTMIADGSAFVGEEIKAKKKAQQIIAPLAKRMHDNGASWRDLGSKAPAGETKEQEVQRLELTRQVRDVITDRACLDSPSVSSALNFDVKGAVRDWNKDRKDKGLSTMTAVEIEAQCAIDSEREGDDFKIPTGYIPKGTMETRKRVSDTASQYIKRIIGALKKLEPEDDAPEKSTGTEAQEEEVIEPSMEKTAEQKAIDSGNDFAKKLRAINSVPDEWISLIYRMIGDLGGVPDTE